MATSSTIIPSPLLPLLLPLLLAVVVVPITLVSSQQMTIPRRPLGYIYKPSKANRSETVTVTTYMDLTCPDSAQAFPILLQLADKLASSPASSNFELVYRSFSLPYHRNSHVINKALHFVDECTRGAGVYPFITDVYENNNSLIPSATANKTDAQVIDLLVPIVSKSAKIPPATFRQMIQERSYELAARLDFKYGCTRGVHSTPTFMVNDVLMDPTPVWTLDQWTEFIKPLL